VGRERMWHAYEGGKRKFWELTSSVLNRNKKKESLKMWRQREMRVCSLVS